MQIRNRHFGKKMFTNDNIYVYKSQLNQNAIWRLVSGGTIIREGGRKHIMEQFYKLRPAKGNMVAHG
jgi:hypothetical protein